MDLRLPAFTALLVFVLIVTGCASMGMSESVVPDRLEGQGLLVGEIRNPDLRGEVSLVIRERSRSVTLHKGYVTTALSPGKYTLESVAMAVGSTDTVITGAYGTSYRTHTQFQHRKINRRFEIKPGMVTNLGLILLVTEDNEWNADVHAVDNTDEMRRYLQVNYPALAVTLNDKSFMLGDGPYVSTSGLADLRKKIARSTLVLRTYFDAGFDDVEYAAGPAGTIARLVRRGRKIVDAQPLETGTLAAVVSGSVEGERRVYLMADGDLMFLENGRLRRVSPPAGAAPAKVHVFGKEGIALADERLQIYVSVDGGRHWQVQPPLAEPTKGGWRLKGFNGRGGFYLYSSYSKYHTQEPPVALYSAYDNIRFARVALPKVDDIAMLVEKSDGLFVKPTQVLFGSDKLYFRAVGSDKWEEYKFPGEGCQIEFLDDTGREISSGRWCGDRRSHDYGRTWIKR